VSALRRIKRNVVEFILIICVGQKFIPHGPIMFVYQFSCNANLVTYNSILTIVSFLILLDIRKGMIEEFKPRISFAHKSS
jgi:hypothetical protein